MRWFLSALGGVLLLTKLAHAGEILPNGIQLPDRWPPEIKAPLGNEPMPVPYLQRPPEVIPVDLGRQLFVDDFLIESTNLTRTFHAPRYHAASPVFKAEKPWELDAERGNFAAPYSDGVWYDPRQQKFLMWYRTAGRATALAVSDDGIHWDRPQLDVGPGTNVVLRSVRDSATVWLDHAAQDPAARFKLFEARYRQRAWQLVLRQSPDGIHWSDELAASAGAWDRTTMFYNPFRQVWVASVRGHDHIPKQEQVHRLRCYFEGRTPEAALSWKQSSDDVAKGNTLPHDLQPWVGADRLDPRHPDSRFSHNDPQLYNLDAFPYESLMVGLFTIWQGPDNEVCQELGINKRNEVLVGFSRDAFHWDRSNRERFLGVNSDPKAWNAGNVQSAGGGCLIVGDELWFYCSGRTKHPVNTVSTGLAVMRRDGFASMDAKDPSGQLTTRPFKFSGGHLFVNAAPGKSALRVEVLDAQGEVVPGFSARDCDAISGDHTKARVQWKGEKDLSDLPQPVRLRILLEGGSLYSFWISSGEAGTSRGYVAAGGPEYPGARDIDSPVKQP